MLKLYTSLKHRLTGTGNRVLKDGPRRERRQIWESGSPEYADAQIEMAVALQFSRLGAADIHRHHQSAGAMVSGECVGHFEVLLG